VQPAIARAGSSAALIDVVRANLMQSMIDTLKISETIRVAFHDGKVDFIGAIYHNETGNIEWVRPGE
jgi:carbonic anhydrase